MSAPQLQPLEVPCPVCQAPAGTECPGGQHMGRVSARDTVLMTIPDGKTCRDCDAFKRCTWLISRKGPERTCDWYPIRFRERLVAAATDPKAEAAQPPFRPKRRPLEEQRAYRQGMDAALRSAEDLLRKHPEAQQVISQFRQGQRLIGDVMDKLSTSEARS
jgi:hypothetical protein